MTSNNPMTETPMALRLLLSAAPVLFWVSGLSAEAGTVTFVLPLGATTSAGIFDSGDRLVRTLWSGRFYEKGTITVDWDGLDDDGMAVPPGSPYRARLLAHNVRYVWEGVIGNTSKEITGPTVHRAYKTIHDMAFDEQGHGFYVVGYNEQQNALHRFDTSEPQEQTALAHDDYRRVFRYAATDGYLAYFANIGLYTPAGSPAREPATFVMALRVADGSVYRFPQGRLAMYRGQPGTRWESVIDYDDQDLGIDGHFLSAPSGLAVQRHGNALFVAHKYLNEVRVLDKRAGQLLDNIEVSSPSSIAVAPDDSLWITCRIDGRPTVLRYRLQDSKWTASTAISAGLLEPVAIAVSPIDGTLVVADAGTEQLKAFDDHGKPQWTFGRANGYRDGNPEVHDDRLWLSAGPTYVAFQPDGSFWVGDPGNDRNLHFSAQRRYLEQIMYMPASYRIAVDSSNPSRVFNRYLEFSVDYSLPLARSWRLVRNWAAGLDKSYVGDLDGLRSVVTLSNGRTYGVAPRYDLGINEVVELTAGGVRATGARLDLGVRLYPDGSLRNQVLRLGTLGVYTRNLSGFDPAGNPKWGEPMALAAVSPVTDQDPYNHDMPGLGGGNDAIFPQTSSGVIALFNPGKTAGFHLGGVRAGDSGWLWRSSRSGTWTLDEEGQILNLDGTYEIDRGVQYAGNIVMVSGRHIVYGYHGEAWNGAQADQWMHYLDNGLFIGQFGRPVYPASNKLSAQAGSAGNAFSPQLVAVNGKLYLWHNDESVHGGVHRWRIDGANRIKILEAPIDP
jgi:DNA-binding beta-propeller fold protein YncE